jgi:hypothetical protein
MAEGSTDELEGLLVQVGTCLVRLEKYRRGASPHALAHRRSALDLGAHARRLHHRSALDASAASALTARARALLGHLTQLLADIQAAPEYRAAADRHAAQAGSVAAAAAEVFAGLDVIAPPRDLFAAIPWLRRGRPRPVADLAAEAARVCAEGLPADGDEIAPGVDPALPAVALQPEPPVDEPLVLRIPGTDVPDPVARLTDTGEYLVHCVRLHVSPGLWLRTHLDSDALEGAVADYPRHRRDLADALATLGLRSKPF